MRPFSLWLTILSTGIFVILATVVMSYISLAVPIGPWIEPTILLLMIVITNGFKQYSMVSDRESISALTTIAAGIAGITASACAWSIPAFYFIDSATFTTWLMHPWYFAAIFASVVLSAGGLGLLCARMIGASMMEDAKFPFPVARMLESSLRAADQLKKGYQVLAGAGGALLFGLLQSVARLIPSKITLLPAMTFRYLQLPPLMMYTSVVPMLWAIGFITGHLLAIPFAIGMFTKLFLLEPLRHFGFATTDAETFLLAFCAGLVVQGAVASFLGLPKSIWRGLPRWRSMAVTFLQQRSFSIAKAGSWIEYVVVAGGVVSALWWLGLSVIAQIFVVITVIMCVYQLMVFMASIGLAPLGRFATFVMLPGLVVFGFSPLQATMVAASVEIAGGVAADAISGVWFARKVGLNEKDAYKFQWLGLFICAAVIGFIFWVLISKFGLGSEQLVAQKAQARALLIMAHAFDVRALLLGVAFGFLLKYVRVAASLVLGGLLMPVDWSLILVLSGLSTYLIKQKEVQYPFWSGVFAASSVWMLVRAIFGW